ncbi:MAG: N-formylglutamate amidohydrolase [Gammaproteobacteria bacterium]|nr:N-formylglutamate amidohydrolase [Gammaproteobacteria bacterium]
MARDDALLISCEHGGNTIPQRYAKLFTGAQRVLNSHRAYDRGALEVARLLARKLNAPLITATVSRLLVDLNRSAHHRKLFSEYSAVLSKPQRQRLLDQYYHPHRDAIEQQVDKARASRRPMLHLAIHSLTPELDGEVRTADIGLLYDPRRHREREFCHSLRTQLQQALPGLRVRMNYPYRGTADGLTTALRRQHGDRHYAGIEVEINQRLLDRRDWLALRRQLVAALSIAAS